MSANAPAVAGSGSGRDAPDEREARLRRWERRTEWPLTALSVVFLAGYAWDVLDTGLSATARQWIDGVMWLVWAVFAADYVVRLVMARERRRFLIRNLFDLLVIVLPMLRQLRILRLVTVLVLLNRRVQGRVRGRVAAYVSGTTLLLGVSAALAVLDAERADPEAKIATFGDALWWTLATITTVGYGDYYPVTAEGKLIASGLMVAGIALLGVITGSIASWFVERFGGVEEALEHSAKSLSAAEREEHSLREELRAVHAEVTALRAELARAERRSPEPSGQ